MLDTTKTFEKDNTVYFEVKYRNSNSQLIDPGSPTYSIEDSKGIEQTSGTPTEKSTGIYFFYWTPTSTGDYVVIFSGLIQNYSATIRKKFKVVETDV